MTGIEQRTYTITLTEGQLITVELALRDSEKRAAKAASLFNAADGTDAPAIRTLWEGEASLARLTREAIEDQREEQQQ